MPCNDISENYRLKIDCLDTLVSFEAVKKTCGRNFGEVETDETSDVDFDYLILIN